MVQRTLGGHQPQILQTLKIRKIVHKKREQPLSEAAPPIRKIETTVKTCPLLGGGRPGQTLCCEDRTHGAALQRNAIAFCGAFKASRAATAWSALLFIMAACGMPLATAVS